VQGQLHRKMAGKQLRNRTVEVRADTVESSDSDKEMPRAQVEGFTEVVAKVLGPISEQRGGCICSNSRRN
jgi:hypothetical protein